MTCKICNHPQRIEIETLALNPNISYQKVSDYCKTSLGLDVSHMTVNRHVTGCLNTGKNQETAKTGLSSQDIEQMQNKVTIEPPLIENIQQLKEVLRQPLLQMVANQALIALSKQQANMSGQGATASSEIATLNQMLKMLDMYAENDKGALTK